MNQEKPIEEQNEETKEIDSASYFKNRNYIMRNSYDESRYQDNKDQNFKAILANYFKNEISRFSVKEKNSEKDVNTSDEAENEN